MNNVILVIWTVVAFSQSYQREDKTSYDWRPLGGFENARACHEAASALGLKADRYRCLVATTGKPAGDPR